MDEPTQDDKLQMQSTASDSLQPSVIANPAENHPLLANYYATLDQLEEALQEYAQETGFAVSRRRSKKFTSGQKKGEIQKADLYCDRGRLRESIPKSRKSSTTKSVASPRVSA
jgi:phosphoribosyl-AMP cyclohydrolase